MHVSAHAEVSGVDDLVGAGVSEDGFGVDAGFVGEGAEAGDGVVEGDVDFDGVGDEVFDFLELVKVVLGGDVFAVGDEHAGHEPAERRDAVAFPDADDRGVDVCCSGF